MRRFLHDLTVLAAVTAAGGYALGRIEAEMPPRGLPMLEPIVTDRPAMAWEEAMEVLRHARRYASASVGYGGVVPDEVVAWLIILSGPYSADSLFVDLLDTATPAGRMYALAGIRAIDPLQFRLRARLLRRSREPVNTLVGCEATTMTTAQIVAELDRGAWIEEFISAPRARYFGDLPWPAVD